MHKSRTERDARFQQLQLAFSKSESRISAIDEELSGTKARHDLTGAQIQQLANEIKNLGEAREKLARQIAVSLKKTGQRPIDVEASLREREKLLSETEQHLAVVERALAEKRSRLDVLRQLNEQGEGLTEGSQALLKGKHGSEKFRDAIAGSLVGQLEVDPQFIQAIEAALGRNLHAIVLKDANVASAIIALLKKNKLGQAGLLIPELTTSAQETVEKVLPKGALAWAHDKVTAPQPLEPFVRQLLGSVAVFSDLEQALECKKRELGLPMATLAGEYISAEGIVFGGSREVRSASLLERKAQIVDLEKEEAALGKERDLTCAKRDEAKSTLEIASQLQREFSDTGGQIQNLQSEKTALDRQVAVADERIVQLESELQTARDQFAKEEADLAAFEAAQQRTTFRAEELTEKINQLRLTIATERQRHESLIAQREPMAARDAELSELIAVRQADITTYENKLAVQAQESRDSERLIESRTAEREKVEAHAINIAKQRVTQLATISDREIELRRLRDSLGELQESRGQRQVRESQLQMNIENIVAHISRSYHVDLREFAPDKAAFEKTLRAQVKRTEKLEGGAPATPGSPEFAPPDLEKVVAELRTQLDNMGPVNLDAVHEYDELEERYKFLEAQNTDLTNSRSELLDVIARINSTTRKLFADTFEQVRANFREMFAELF
ncbi:MAG: hypothetical protein DMF00_12365, partial [Verrucomicrobia bacterium]